MTGEHFNFQTKIPVNPEIMTVIKNILNKNLVPSDFMGWTRLPEDRTGQKEVSAWLKKIKKNQTTMCVLGIGGSCLGARAVYDFVSPKKQLQFFDNIDGFAFEKRLASLDLKKCHFMAISKSGETSETLFQLAHLLQLLFRKKLKIQDHVTVITEDKPSSLKKIGEDLGLFWLSVPQDVGGRFSVLSTVGLAPLMWSGVSANDLLNGAIWAKGQIDSVGQAVSFFQGGFARHEWISVFWAYVDGLKTFGLWLEQLWAESLAKAESKSQAVAPRCSTPIVCIGATDQHSLLQQFTEGARDKHFMFLRSKLSEKSQKIQKVPSSALKLAQGRSVGELLGIEAAATQKILDQLGIATCRLTIQKQNAKTIGALLFFFEMVVAVLGETMNINAFNQPGVEAVKKVTLGTLGDTRYKDQALNNT